MVKKLIKHEFIYYIRTLGLFLPIVLIIGIMTRIFNLFDNTKTINRIVASSSNTLLMMSCTVLLILAVVASIVRFYKNMYSAEGYLTFTLPVSNFEHIFVKLFVSVVNMAVCVFTAILANSIAILGKDLIEAFNDIADIIKFFVSHYNVGNTIAFIIELIVFIIVVTVYFVLLGYACITIGQTAKKNRIIKAIGAYFVYYFITQVLGTILLISISVFGATEAFIHMLQWIGKHPIITLHMLFCGLSIVFAVIAAAFWFVTQRIMSRKLNLE